MAAASTEIRYRLGQLLIGLPVALVVLGWVLLWFLSSRAESFLTPSAAQRQSAINLTALACPTCNYTVGDQIAGGPLSAGTAQNLVLTLDDLPPGFTVVVDEQLTIEDIAKDDESARQFRDAGHISGWWREYTTDSGRIEIYSGANIYASSQAATNLIKLDVPSSFGPETDGKSRPVLVDVTIGDESQANVFESPGQPQVVAAVFFRVGAINEWMYVVASPADLSPELFLKLAYAQLAHSRPGAR